jgi:hypothetical protein
MYFTLRHHKNKKHIIHIRRINIFFHAILHFETHKLCMDILFYDFHINVIKIL